jgi:hypothetical protein
VECVRELWLRMNKLHAALMQILLMICLHNYLKQNKTLHVMVFPFLESKFTTYILILMCERVQSQKCYIEGSMLVLLMYCFSQVICSMKHKSLISPLLYTSLTTHSNISWEFWSFYCNSDKQKIK